MQKTVIYARADGLKAIVSGCLLLLVILMKAYLVKKNKNCSGGVADGLDAIVRGCLLFVVVLF